jgi:hypothetical protein
VTRRGPRANGGPDRIAHQAHLPAVCQTIPRLPTTEQHVEQPSDDAREPWRPWESSSGARAALRRAREAIRAAAKAKANQ